MRRSILVLGKPFWLALAVLLCSFAGWSQQAPLDQRATSALADPQDTQASARGQQYTQQQTGSISGKVIDQSGNDIAGAVVTLKREGQSSELEATSNGDGLFHIHPGLIRDRVYRCPSRRIPAHRFIRGSRAARVLRDSAIWGAFRHAADHVGHSHAGNRGGR